MLDSDPTSRSRPLTQRSGLRLLASASAFALLLAGCASPTPTANRGEQMVDPEPLTSQAPAGFESYYGQAIDWSECEAGQVTPALMAAPEDLGYYQCGTLDAPMNWDDPDSEPIELAVARYLGAPEKGERPPLFYNLGGPGGGAVESLSAVVANIVTDQVAQAYNIVALDPRGVGASSPIWCMTDEERDTDNARDVDVADMSLDERVAWNDAEIATIGDQCLERNGEILGFVDSDSAARDFDMTRAVLGAEIMDYLGFSYGTLLGAIYADLFPDHVGRFVLDGVLDPAMNLNEVSAAQIAGMEASLYNWIETCVTGKNCPLGSTLEEGKETMVKFFEDVAASPLPTADPQRPLTEGLANTAVIGTLYSTDSYQLLTQAMAQALEGDGSMLLFLADYFNDRGEDGVFMSNQSDAFLAVNMLDYEPVGTPEQWEVEAQQIAAANPILGADYGFASAGISQWPVESRAPRRSIQAQDAPEMLLIGTTHDPATPFVMAENLHKEIPNTTLLTVEGWNHTAYSASASSCVRGAVDRFLLNGELPEDGTVCD